MPLPNFLVIGAMKAATTSLYHYLGQHPDVYVSPMKETSFFALEGHPLDFDGAEGRAVIGPWARRASVTDIAAYRALFDGVAGETAIGEASPLYLYHPDAPPRIARYVPNAKLIAVLRDPAERAYSAFLYMRRDGREPIADFAGALAAEPARIRASWEWMWHYRAVGFYHRQLRRYFDLFPAEQIRVWLYEDLRANAAAVVRDVFRFLGVDDAFTPDTSLAHNRSGVPRSERAIRLLNRPNPLRSALRALLPSDARRRIRIRLQDLLLAKPPSLDPVVRRDLVASYREDVLALGRLIGRDLSHWLA